MQKPLLLFCCCAVLACKQNITFSPQIQPTPPPLPIRQKQLTDKNSWAFFLQHLPEKEGPVVDYRGHTVDDQEKKFRLINYDIGTRDLQQCADALMRLRAEFLFSQKRLGELRFHFTSGHPYSFYDYCRGQRPVPAGNSVRFREAPPVAASYSQLRRYLDLVYSYAGTISLANELSAADSLDIGTVIISPGSPGHCLIITNEATTPSGEKLFKLVEGYSPAQSMYVLRNVAEPQLGYWHRLQQGIIHTASYTFRSYRLRKFE